MRFIFRIRFPISGIFITYNIHMDASHPMGYPKCRCLWPNPPVTTKKEANRTVLPIDRTPLGSTPSTILRRTPPSGRSIVHLHRYTGCLEMHGPVNTWNDWEAKEVLCGELGRLSPPSGCRRLILGNTPLKTSQNANPSLQDPAPRPILGYLVRISGKRERAQCLC